MARMRKMRKGSYRHQKTPNVLPCNAVVTYTVAATVGPVHHACRLSQILATYSSTRSSFNLSSKMVVP